MGKKSSGGGGAEPSESKHEQKLQAVVVTTNALGNSFHPAAMEIPPSLIPLNNVALIDYAVEALAGAGVEELFVFICGSGKRSRSASGRGTGEGDEDEEDLSHPVEQHLRNNRHPSMDVRCIFDPSCLNEGDALRELDKRAVIRSDPFILFAGDIITNVDLGPALAAHRERKARDSAAIMTVLMKRVDGVMSPSSPSSAHDADDSGALPTTTYSALRASVDDDLVIGTDPADASRIVLYDCRADRPSALLPTSFLSCRHRVNIRTDLIDVGVYVCSPDVLARFSDEFDYRSIRRQFLPNSAAEEEQGLQSRLHAQLLAQGEYAARVSDFRTHHVVSRDLLRRWCYPAVPDNPPRSYNAKQTDQRRHRYVLQRRFLYREVATSTIASTNGVTSISRTARLVGPGMVARSCRIGDRCSIERSVLGPKCEIGAGSTLRDSDLWEGVVVENGVTIDSSILCDGCLIRSGAKVGKGCVVGAGCVVGTNVVIPDFTRITRCNAAEDGFEGGSADGDFGDFDDDGGKSQEGKEESSTTDTEPLDEVETDHEVVGRDGLGRVWKPPLFDDDVLEAVFQGAKNDPSELAAEITRSQSVGFDVSSLRRARTEMLMEEDDFFSDEEQNDDLDDEGGQLMPDGGGIYGTLGGDVGSTPYTKFSTSQQFSTVQPIPKRLTFDIIGEMKLLCVEYESTSPIENLAIELNSIKFSQNARFSDCCTGATLGIIERMQITPGMTKGKLVAALKKETDRFGPLFKKFCQGTEEEQSILEAVETAALGVGDVGTVLSTEPIFRLVLQTLHDEGIVNEDAILAWAGERRADDAESPAKKLFLQEPTQEFLVWLEEEEDDEEDEDDED